MKIKINSNDPNLGSKPFDLKDPAALFYLSILAKKTNILFKYRNNKEILLLRGHIAIEFFLNEIIKIQLPKGGDFLIDNLTFYKKLSLVEKLEVVQPDIINFAKVLNKIRNKCAHELEYIVSKNDLEELGFCFKKEYEKLVKIDRGGILLNMLISVLVNLVHDTFFFKKH